MLLFAKHFPPVLLHNTMEDEKEHERSQISGEAIKNKKGGTVASLLSSPNLMHPIERSQSPDLDAFPGSFQDALAWMPLVQLGTTV